MTTTTAEDCLLRVASAGNVPEMELLLRDSTMLSAALRVRNQLIYLQAFRSVPYLLFMVQAAAETGQASMVEFLLHVGKLHDVDPATLINSDSISNAILSKDVEVLRTMFAVMPSLISFNLGMGLSPLEQSMSTGSIPIMKFLLENGADPNYSFNPNKPPLQDAAGKSALEIIQLLLSFGASISSSWPCHAAARYGRVDVLMILFEHGADLSRRFASQPGSYYIDLETPLDVAVQHKQTAVAKWLSNKGAELHLVDMAELTLVNAQPEDTKGIDYREPRRSTASYNGVHTEEQWRSSMDDYDDTPEAIAARKAARRVRREQNERERLAQTASSIDDTDLA